MWYLVLPYPLIGIELNSPSPLFYGSVGKQPTAQGTEELPFQGGWPIQTGELGAPELPARAH